MKRKDGKHQMERWSVGALERWSFAADIPFYSL